MIHRPAARTYHNVGVKRLFLHVRQYYRQAIVQSVVGVVLVLMEEPFKRAVSLKIYSRLVAALQGYSLCPSLRCNSFRQGGGVSVS